MTVHELRKALGRFPPDVEVRIAAVEAGGGRLTRAVAVACVSGAVNDLAGPILEPEAPLLDAERKGATR